MNVYNSALADATMMKTMIYHQYCVFVDTENMQNLLEGQQSVMYIVRMIARTTASLSSVTTFECAGKNAPSGYSAVTMGCVWTVNFHLEKLSS